MCRRFQLLARIEQATVQDIIRYLYRLSRIYVILAIFSLINVVEAYYTEPRLVVTLTIIYTVLYLINVTMITLIARQPNIPNCTNAMISNITLFLFNIAFMVFNVVVIESLWALASLIGIFFQSTTIYILYKLRVKMVNGEDMPLAEAQVEYGANARGPPPPIVQAQIIGNANRV